MELNQIIILINSAIFYGTVIMFGALGEIVTEKSGNLNLGVPGVMYLGAIGGLIGAFFYESPIIAAGGEPVAVVGMLISLACALIFSMMGGLIFSFLTITLHANQNVTGLTLTIFGAGFANFLGGSLTKLAGGVGQISVATTSSAFSANLQSVLGKNPFTDLFLVYGFMPFLVVILAIVANYMLKRTRVGLNLRAVGENPATADAAGVHVTRYKYFATIIGAGLSGLGGLYYTMDYTKGTWLNDATIESLGWLAVALVIFATWKPLNVIWGSYLFGFLIWVYLYIPGLDRSTMEIFRMLPYIVTIVVLVVTSMRNKKDQQPPNSLGLSYFREER